MDDHTVTGRVVAVLDAVAGLGDDVTLAALTRSTGIPKPTVRRIAADLVHRGLLRRGEEGYRLGPRLLQLGVRAADQQGLRDVAVPYVQDLFARCREVVWLTAFTETTNVIIDSAFGRHRAADMRRPWPTKIRTASFLATAAGRIVLAHRPELVAELRSRPLPRLTRYTTTNWTQVVRAVDAVRDNGYAIEHEQLVLGYNCVAAGLRDNDGHLVGAIGITGRTGSFIAERQARAVFDAASEIAGCLGGKTVLGVGRAPIRPGPHTLRP